MSGFVSVAGHVVPRIAPPDRVELRQLRKEIVADPRLSFDVDGHLLVEGTVGTAENIVGALRWGDDSEGRRPPSGTDMYEGDRPARITEFPGTGIEMSECSDAVDQMHRHVGCNRKFLGLCACPGHSSSVVRLGRSHQTRH